MTDRMRQRSGLRGRLAFGALVVALLFAVLPADAQDGSKKNAKAKEKAAIAKAAAARGETDGNRPVGRDAGVAGTDESAAGGAAVEESAISPTDEPAAADEAPVASDEAPDQDTPRDDKPGNNQKAKNKRAKTNQAKTNQAKTNQAKTNRAKTNSGKAGATEDVAVKSEAAETVPDPLEHRAELIGGVVLKDLEQTRKQPLFTPVRHPPKPPAPPPPKKKVVKAPPPPPAPPKPPSLRLVGVVMTDDSTLALMLANDRSVKRVALGDKIEGWSVVTLEPDMVELKLKNERSVYRMFKPGEAGASGLDDTSGKNKNKRKNKKKR